MMTSGHVRWRPGGYGAPLSRRCRPPSSRSGTTGDSQPSRGAAISAPMKTQDAAGIVDRLEQEYRQSVDALQGALKSFLKGGPPPDPALRRTGAFVYPELRLYWPPGKPWPRISRA